MAKLINVYKSSQLLSAVKEHKDKVFKVVHKKEVKSFKNTVFSNAQFNMPGNIKAEGWFSIEEPIELPNGIADPEDTGDIRNTYEGTRMNFQTTLSRAGILGEALDLLDGYWREIAPTLPSDTEPRKISGILTRNLSAKNKANPKGLLDDPVIRFQVDFDNYSAKHPHKFLQNQPKTQIFDYDTARVDETGVTRYDLATVNGQPLTAKNFHLFVTPGSLLMPGSRISMPSVAVSDSYISWPMLAGKSIVKRGPPPGFSDDIVPDISKLVSALTILPKPIEVKSAQPEEIVAAKPIEIKPTIELGRSKPIAPKVEKKDDTLPDASDIESLLDGI